ncbi:MAG: phosphatidate cytidylyltransferase [Treponema sp.]|nr:phosphatidate cytidylyltransferase [Treponema sp.]
MPKLAQRLIVFFIGIPLVIAVIIPDFLNHLLFQLLLLVFSFLASSELCNMLSQKGKIIPKPLLIFLSIIIPLASYLCGLFEVDFIIVDLVFITSIMAVFAYEVLFVKDFEDSNTKIANGVLTVFYSGFLPSFIARLTVLDDATILICLFFVFVFISDSAAWLFGMTLGKNNRGIIAASPNKSIAGFAGSYLGTLFIVFLIKFFFKDFIFPDVSPVKLIILAICISTSSIIGDLAESVFKRSSGCKDSGNIILGRGGALDSIDSILMSAPFFYIFVKYFF